MPSLSSRCLGAEQWYDGTVPPMLVPLPGVLREWCQHQKWVHSQIRAPRCQQGLVHLQPAAVFCRGLASSGCWPLEGGLPEPERWLATRWQGASRSPTAALSQPSSCARCTPQKSGVVCTCVMPPRLEALQWRWQRCPAASSWFLSRPLQDTRQRESSPRAARGEARDGPRPSVAAAPQ